MAVVGEHSIPVSRIVTAIALIAFLLLCLGLGGASRGNTNWTSLLQITGLVLLGVVALSRPNLALPGKAWPVAAAFFALTCIGAATLLPIPPEWWTQIPGRSAVKAGFDTIHAPAPWLPLSMAPAATLSALLNLIPPVVIFLLACWVGWSYGIEPMVWLIPAVALLSLGLGVAQVYGGDTADLYLYQISNRGLPSGIFSNVNHQATLLLVAMPFSAALSHQVFSRARHGAFRWEKAGMALSVLLALAAGVFLTGSIAGYVLLLPIMLSCVALLVTGGSMRAGAPLAIFAGAFIAVAAVVAGSPLVLAADTSFDAGPLSRLTIFQNTWRAILDLLPAGAGLGSFETVYPSYEAPNAPALQFVNHAHSDGLEIVFELGAPGAILAVLFLIWYLYRSGTIWAQRRGSDAVLGKAATIGIAVILLHSLIDYPSRTIAISSLGALCLAIMVKGRSDSDIAESDHPVLRGIVL